jgi:hypothetical protein
VSIETSSDEAISKMSTEGSDESVSDEVVLVEQAPKSKAKNTAEETFISMINSGVRLFR